MPVIKLSGEIKTNNYGFNKLIEFYYRCLNYSNVNISIDLYSLRWMDANLSAFFQSIIYKLIRERNLSFSTDKTFVDNRFSVLRRNGFLNFDEPIEDNRESTVGLKMFDSKECNNFDHYIQNDLLNHRSLCDKTDLVENITDNLLEVFNNYQIHANTQDPVFVCGQYFPNRSNGEVNFTMVDLGVGFLDLISAKDPNIDTSVKAIRWALIEKNTTKSITHNGEPGGLGLYDLYQYMKDNNGILEIITGDVYWTSKHQGTKFDSYKTLLRPYIGTTINLVFNCN